jgi:hypothetical protein
MRAWTYAVYASERYALAGRPLSVEDIEWFRSTLAVDYRAALVALTHVFFLWAAFVPASIDARLDDGLRGRR